MTLADGTCYTCDHGDKPISGPGASRICLACLSGKKPGWKKAKKVRADRIPKGLKTKDGTPISMEG